MTFAPRKTPLIRSLLIAALVGVISGLPFVCLAFHSNPGIVLLMLTEEVVDGEAGEFEFELSELFALCEDVDELASPAYTHRVADDLAQTDSALAESHLQRGPPGC